MVTGHVAFFVEDRGDRLLVLGGNQSDCVCLKAYPKHGYLTDTVGSGGPVRELYELIGYRWPAPAGGRQRSVPRRQRARDPVHQLAAMLHRLAVEREAVEGAQEGQVLGGEVARRGRRFEQGQDRARRASRRRS